MDKLEWAELWAAMKANPAEWIPTTENMYHQMLECLPPRAMGNKAFLVGEADHHNESDEAVYACFAESYLGGYFARYLTVKEFKELQK